jgi:hypothetical protein
LRQRQSTEREPAEFEEVPTRAAVAVRSESSSSDNEHVKFLSR